MSLLFPLPGRVKSLPIGELRRKRDTLLKALSEVHKAALLEKLSVHPFHLVSRLTLLGKREDQLNSAERETLKPELTFLELCRKVYNAEHAATSASLVRATQQELL